MSAPASPPTERRSLWKTAKGGRAGWQPCRVAAHPKLTYRRETRLLALLVFGEPLECACCAIGISSTAIRKRIRRDPAFAERVSVAREPHQVGDDWRSAGVKLEFEVPEDWSLPDSLEPM